MTTDTQGLFRSDDQFSVSGFLFPVFHSLHQAIDVLACPGCGGRLRLIATIEHRAVIEKILRDLGLPVDPPEPAPPRHPAWLPGFEVPIDSATEWPG